ncbi:hypothetical protein AB4Y87_24950 [Paenarthrobacter sp. RAF54_2]|uniref:hypothetical protein n=1 Tax=Paenarthrobacter sp. RAF54_2 TaxID=3233061 RepID=UPI003F99369B
MLGRRSGGGLPPAAHSKQPDAEYQEFDRADELALPVIFRAMFMEAATAQYRR